VKWKLKTLKDRVRCGNEVRGGRGGRGREARVVR